MKKKILYIACLFSNKAKTRSGYLLTRGPYMDITINVILNIINKKQQKQHVYRVSYVLHNYNKVEFSLKYKRNEREHYIHNHDKLKMIWTAYRDLEEEVKKVV